MPVRIYTPIKDQAHRLLVSFYGSGFVIFDLDTHGGECRPLANRSNVIVVSVACRLAPEYPFPAAFVDCLVATQWAIEHSDELGSGGGGVALGGDNAGGNLAAAVTAALQASGSQAVQFQMLIYPVTDHSRRAHSYEENGVGYLLTPKPWSSSSNAMHQLNLIASTSGQRRFLASSFAGLPRTLVVTAEYDPLRDEGEEYAEALARAGVDVTLRRYQGAVHGFSQMSNFSTPARDLIDLCGTQLQDALG